MALSKVTVTGKWIAFILFVLTIVSTPKVLRPTNLASIAFILLTVWAVARFYFLYNSYRPSHRLAWTIISDVVALVLLPISFLQIQPIGQFMTGLLIYLSFYLSIMIFMPSPVWFKANFKHWFRDLFFLDRY
ncbi:hypothetical protein [Oenococcus sicerae]|uniref:Uncharacterized protein n=1 Tax=Oenococcus sicerae TaxID=2203724 RepID=A0AAJ1RC23_9LACO|nr:hypothetical protein [Oenococcus sicerae]MDN6900165.1 hypothetical protein [Oenococcus sicerae]